MGCCVSTKKPSTTSPEFHHRHSSRAPPPVEEETVKEVLSETPNTNHFPNKIEDDDEPTKYVPTKIQRNQQHNNNCNNLEDMNVSEICSTMSESNSTTTFEEDVPVVLRRRVTDRSPAKLRNSGELRVVRNSPVRGKQQSPGRVRSVSETNNRGSGYYSAGRQRPVPGTAQASRSRSPANRMVARGGGGGGGARNVGRSPSARKTEKSPSRIGSGLPERVVKPDVSSGIERDESSWAPTPTDGNDDELLDNPLVSLECFIFL